MGAKSQIQVYMAKHLITSPLFPQLPIMKHFLGNCFSLAVQLICTDHERVEKAKGSNKCPILLKSYLIGKFRVLTSNNAILNNHLFCQRYAFPSSLISIYYITLQSMLIYYHQLSLICINDTIASSISILFQFTKHHLYQEKNIRFQCLFFLVMSGILSLELLNISQYLNKIIPF